MAISLGQNDQILAIAYDSTKYIFFNEQKKLPLIRLHRTAQLSAKSYRAWQPAHGRFLQ